jgi:ketopantoate reductase
MLHKLSWSLIALGSQINRRRVFERFLSRGTASMAPACSDTPIHILGVGNLGKYVAYSLVKSSPKPVTLIFHRKSLEDEWRAEGEAVTCITDGIRDSRSGFGIETLPTESPAPEPIKHLIITTKAYMTVDALKPLKHRLNSNSSILFLQNGMGGSALNTFSCPSSASH